MVRLEFVAHGMKEHTGVGARVVDLGVQIVTARAALSEILDNRLTLTAADGWNTEYRFPFIAVGQPGVYNITADLGQLGLEIRPIPQDDVTGLLAELDEWARAHDLEVRVRTKEPGVVCDRDNPYLQTLVEAVRQVSGGEPAIGRKQAGTSGRFAPAGQAVVWGQSGIGPHSPAERHYIPSIAGYYAALDRFAELLAPP